MKKRLREKISWRKGLYTFGSNFHYNIVMQKPPLCGDDKRLAGPFRSMREARGVIRGWMIKDMDKNARMFETDVGRAVLESLWTQFNKKHQALLALEPPNDWEKIDLTILEHVFRNRMKPPTPWQGSPFVQAPIYNIPVDFLGSL